MDNLDPRDIINNEAGNPDQDNDLIKTDAAVELSSAEETAAPDAEIGQGSGVTGEIAPVSCMSQQEASFDTLKNSSFYTETYRKTNGRKPGSLGQLILVSVISAFVGAFAFAVLFLLIAPAVQPGVKDYISSITGNDSTGTSGAREVSTAPSRKVEIVGESNLVAEIAEKVGPSVVGVKVSFTSQDWLFGQQQDSGVGSGIIIRDNGYIMTNFHVVQNALDSSTKKVSKGSRIEVILPSRKDKPYTAEYIGGDSRTDIAVIKINGNNLPEAELGDSDRLKVGELAVAIGNPGGLELAGSVTSGVISGVNRSLPLDDGTHLQLIQTDAAISPGNSGGALVNSKGEVIGINRLKIVSDEVEGLGFAIPVNKAREITKSLIESGYVKGRPWLGIRGASQYTEEIAKSYNMPIGVYVIDVEMLSAAFKAGIQANDIITKFDGKPVKNIDELNEIKDKHKPGDTVTAEIYREDKYLTKQITLGEAKQ